MDLNLQHLGSLAKAPLKHSFEGYDCTTPNNSSDNSGDTALRLDSHSCDQNRADHCFHAANRSGSIPDNSASPKELLKKWDLSNDARLTPLDLDDDCGLVLALGCNASSAYSRGSSLPETSSTGTFLKDNNLERPTNLGSDLLAQISVGIAPKASLEAMQVCGTSTVNSRVVRGLTDGAVSGLSNHDGHNIIRGGQSVNSSPGSSTFTQPEILKNKLQEESTKNSGAVAVVTASLDVDPDILQLGLSRGPIGLGKSSVINRSSAFTKTDCVLVPGRRQEILAIGTESPSIMHIPVDEGSTSARGNSGGYMPSLLMAPILGSLDLDGRDQSRNASFATIFSRQESAEVSTRIRELSQSMSVSGTSGHAEQRSSSKTCKFKGCGKGARGASGLCIAHGGGHRCQKSGCNKGAESRTVYCKAHGGGRRCQRLGCTKSAEGRTDYCIGHGGGRRCSHEGCGKAARGKSGLCIRHGGGKRCQKEGCTKSAEGYSGLCISHGGGRRCQYPDCSKGAQGSTMYCKAHGGGKRCMFTGCTKGAEGSTPLCKGHGGGKRCMFDGGGMCPKSVHGGTKFCVAHGGGKRCAVQGCTKSARGRTDYCVKHGGGKRCKFEGCGKSAQGSTDFCKAHGGGKRCLWGQVGSVYAGEILNGKNGEMLQGACDRFARGKTGLCAAHIALVQDQRFHGGGNLGPGLFHGLTSALVPSADTDSSAASALSSDNLPQLGSGFEIECFGKQPSEALNGIESYSAVPFNMDQNTTNDVDMESTEKKNGLEDKLRPPVLSKTWPEINHVLKWNVYSNGGQMVAPPTSVGGIVDASKGHCEYQSAFIYPNIHMGADANTIPGGTEVGSPVIGHHFAFVQLPVEKDTDHSQVPGPVLQQQLIPSQVLVPLSMKKTDLTNLPMARHNDGSGSNEGGSLYLPEGRVHGGGLMAMLGRDLRPGDHFVPFSGGASDAGITAQRVEQLRTFQHAVWM